MKAIRAILVDSLRESIDHNAMTILLALIVIIAALMGGNTFEERPTDEILMAQVQRLPRISERTRRGGTSSTSTNADIGTVEARKATKEDGLGSEFEDGYLLVLRFETERDIDRLTCRWIDFKSSGSVTGMSMKTRSTTLEERVGFLNERMAHDGWSATAVQCTDEGASPTFRIALAADDLGEVSGAHIKHQMYGVMDPHVMSRSKTESVITAQLGLANNIMAVGGILITLLVTAGFIPSMLRKGSLDLMLARPVGRGRLLLSKYLGGIWFIVLVSCAMITLCWIVFAVRAGVTNPVFFMTIPVLALCFAVVYSISTLLSVVTRSGALSALIAVAVWWVTFIVHMVRLDYKMSGGWEELPGWVRGLIETIYTILPKTTDLLLLNTVALSRSQLSDAAYQRTFADQVPDVDWFFSMGTTAAFTAVMLGLAVRTFKRRDY